MITIGVTGGVGAGKSTVLDYLEHKWGARILRLDDVGRTVLDPGTTGYEEAIALFGKEIVMSDGFLDRKQMASRIFGNDELLGKLNAIVHPAVKSIAKKEKENALIAGEKLFVIEAALLIEDHYDEICDELWYIYADEKTRRARLSASRGYSEERISETMRSQLSEESFRKHCACTIDNGMDFLKTEHLIDQRIKELIKE